MGFALWHRGQLLYCEGTHEYRPMGTAIAGDRGTFSQRDFSKRGIALKRGRDGFVGYFASLNDVNRFLSQDRDRIFTQKRNPHRILTII